MFVQRITVSAIAALLAGSVAVSTGFAAGGALGNSTTAPAVGKTPDPVKKSPKASKCKRGETSKRLKRKGKLVRMCVKLKAEVLTDAELYQNARLLADEGEYEWALDHLRLITNQNDVEVLNYTGYSNRKAGRLETGISYYYKALAIDPNYVQAREYLGEAYVLAGRVDLAKAQLQEIALRCGTSCPTYISLNQAILSPAF
jgi:tetratricopeptide (TPR) repeat protein